MSHEQQHTNLRNHFLVAMPGLQDPNFAHSVSYLCDHTSDGAMGIVINRPLDLSWHDIFDHLDIDDSHTHIGAEPVLAGGPVQVDRGFVLHRPTRRQWESSLAVTSDIVLTTSLDIIAALAVGDGPQSSLMALGYAGWGAGQLETELAANAWLAVPADSHILFELPYGQRAAAAARKLGIDLSLLSSEAGHA